VDDLASAAVEKATGRQNEIVNAIGPETFTYRQLVETIKQTLGSRACAVSVPSPVGYLACRILGLYVGDVIITQQEIRGLMEGRLYVDAPPLGATRLTEWIAQHSEILGRHYTSELARRVDAR